MLLQLKSTGPIALFRLLAQENKSMIIIIHYIILAVIILGYVNATLTSSNVMLLHFKLMHCFAITCLTNIVLQQYYLNRLSNKGLTPQELLRNTLTVISVECVLFLVLATSLGFCVNYYGKSDPYYDSFSAFYESSTYDLCAVGITLLLDFALSAISYLVTYASLIN